MICPNCGKETVGKFCPACGTKLVAEPVAAAAAAVNEAVQDWNKPEPVAPAAPEPVAEPVRPAAPQAPNPAYAPQTPNQGYAPNQAYAPNQGYAPNPGYAPNQAYAPNQGQPASGFVAGQGYNPGVQNVGGYRAPAGAVGQTSASQFVRKLATSPLFILGALLMTLAFGLSAYFNVRTTIYAFDMLDRYSDKTQVITTIVTAIATVVVGLIAVIAVWSIVASAANKATQKMSTGGLTTFKVFAVFGLIGCCLLFVGSAVLLVLYLVNNDVSDIANQVLSGIHSYLDQYDVDVMDLLDVDVKTYIIILFGIALAVALFGIIYFSKLIKTLNTGKRVINTGIPDDRVSIFVGVVSILAFAGNVYNAVQYFRFSEYGVDYILMGCNYALSALGVLCLAFVLFKFRSGMRAMGSYKGVMQRPVQ